MNKKFGKFIITIIKMFVEEIEIFSRANKLMFENFNLLVFTLVL